MPLLQGLAILLVCQSAGELLARGLHLPLPGPVLGLGLLGALLAWRPLRAAIEARVGMASDALLAHLSLLFVPLGVGVISHLGVLREHALALGLVIVGATLAGMAVTAWVLNALWREPAQQPPQHPAAEPRP